MFGRGLLKNLISSQSLNLGGRRGTTDDVATIPFHSSAALSLQTPFPFILWCYLFFFCLPLLLAPFTVPCRIVFAMPEDLEMWPYHLSFRFFTTVRGSSCTPVFFFFFFFFFFCLLFFFALEASEMFLSLHMIFSLERAAVVWAILERISGFDPSLEMIAPRYLKFSTSFSLWSFILISLWKPFGLFVITFVLSGPISILYLMVVVSRRSTRTPASSSSSAGARWLSGRVSDSGARGPGFETYRRRVVSLSKTLYSPKVLVNYPGSDGSVPIWLKNCWLGR